MKSYSKRLYYQFNVVRGIIFTFGTFIKDFIQWVKYSHSFSDNNQKRLQAKLLLRIHSLEKGMSFPIIRNGFGSNHSLTLSSDLEKYISKYDYDEYTDLAINLLETYLSHPESAQIPVVIKRFERIKEKSSSRKLDSGVKSVEKRKIPDYHYDDVYDFVQSRSSIREFSQRNICTEEIQKAKYFAATAPSVCNRQACSVEIYDQQEMIDKILDLQLGNQGWAHKANKLFIVTADLNFFGGIYERNQAYIDGGMYAMQFVLGLHAQKIATCCKMYIRKPSLDEKLRQVTGIKNSVLPIMLILAGHYSEEAVKVPVSHRFIK